MKSDHVEVAKRLAKQGNVAEEDGLNQLVNLGMVRGSSTREKDETTNGTQFDAIAHDQRSMTIVYTNSSTLLSFYDDKPLSDCDNDSAGYHEKTKDVGVFRLPDPHHDSNKLYGVLKGLPLRQALQIQLEDLGIEEKDCRRLPPTTSSNVQDFQSATIHASQCIGGAWLDDADDSLASNVKEWPQGARVALAVGNWRSGSGTTSADVNESLPTSGTVYSVVIYPANEIFPSPSSTVRCADLITSLLQLQQQNSKESSPSSILQLANVIIPIIMPRRIQTAITVMFHG